MLKKSSAILPIVAFVGTLGLGASSTATADIQWVKTMRQHCPNVCQKSDYKFAVSAGTNKRAEKERKTEQVYYVCATNFSGWRVGFNIDYSKTRCYTGFRQSEIYGESYYCLCNDKPVKPIGK